MRLPGPRCCARSPLPVAGCGFGSGESTGEVTLTVTRDFGGDALHEGVDRRRRPRATR